MSGADSTTEVTPTGRYEDHSLFIGSNFDLAQKVLRLFHALVLDLFEAERLGVGAPVSDSAIQHQQVEITRVIVRIELEGSEQGFLGQIVFSHAEANDAELRIGIGVIGMGCERLFHCLKRLRKLSFLSV